MPNFCDYSIKVVGSDEENLKKFISYIQNDYHYIQKNSPEYKADEMEEGYSLKFEDNETVLFTNADKHFYRVFEADAGDIEKDDDYVCVYIYGNCAWSVSSCMLSSDSGYYDKSVSPDSVRGQHQYCLEDASKDLGLTIEVYSTEPGVGFAEHYIIKDGKLLVDDCHDYTEIYVDDYETKEECEEDNDVEISDEEWEEAKDSGDAIVKSDCDYDPYNFDWTI